MSDKKHQLQVISVILKYMYVDILIRPLITLF